MKLVIALSLAALLMGCSRQHELITYTLPTPAAKTQYCVANSPEWMAPTTGILEIQTSAPGQSIIFTDGTVSASVRSAGSFRDAACVVGVDTTHWKLCPRSGKWSKY